MHKVNIVLIENGLPAPSAVNARHADSRYMEGRMNEVNCGVDGLLFIRKT